MPASKADMAAEFLLYRRYQILHHKDSPDEVTRALSSKLALSCVVDGPHGFCLCYI